MNPSCMRDFLNQMDTSEMKKHQLLEAAEEKLVTLENAKRRLYQNSSELKSQIHSQMSRLLEALRNREVQLLNQVDQIQTHREEALHKQHAVLSRSLGQLQRAVVSHEEDLDEKFEKLSLSDLAPEELPYMTFKGTPIGLNDVLMNFGRITANGIPLPDNRSASLPKQFEDYGDAEHHVLYKTVEKIQQGPNTEKKIYVNIPRLRSASPSEWLAKKTSVTTTSSTSDSFTKYMFAPFKDSKSSSWLAESSSSLTTVRQPYTMCLPQMTKNTSIQHWLHQIKQNPDNEEDGFEMLDRGELSSDGDTDSIEIVSSSPPSVVYGPQYKTAGDKRCRDTDNSQWLSSPKRKVMAMEKSTNLPTFSYFKKLAAQDINIWLAKKKSNSSVSKSSCCSTTDVKNCDIENLGDSACVNKFTKNLRTLSQTIREPCHDTDENLGSPLPPVSSLCKANEICEKYSECLSKPSCIEQKWLINKPDSSTENNNLNKPNPLMPTKSPSHINSKERDVLFSPFVNKTEMSVWLKSKEDKENVPVERFSLKTSHIGNSSKSLNDWLIKPNDKKQAVFSTKFTTCHGNDIKTWLVKPTSNEICMLRE